MTAVVDAVYFDGRSSRAHAVKVCAGAGLLGISAADWQRSEALANVRVTPRVAGIHRTLLLADGGQLQVGDNDAVDAWFPERQRGAALIDRLERHSIAVAAALLVTAFSLAGLIFFGIPYAAKRVADYIPAAVERSMGEQTVKLLDRFGFDKSELPQKQRDELQAVFRRYVADLPQAKRYELHFMKAKMPNAFALPGGIIVVTDEMLRLVADNGQGDVSPTGKSTADAGADDDEDDDGADDRDGGDAAARAGATPAAAGANTEEAGSPEAATGAGAAATSDELPALADLSAPDKRFLAVVAHEIGHEEHKHVLRSVLQNSAVLLIGAYFTGDVSSASALVVSVPTFLLDNHYSRAFESEADDYAFASLAAHGISPGYFAEVMTSMQRTMPGALRRGDGGYLSTHPATVDRILSAQAAALAFQEHHASDN